MPKMSAVERLGPVQSFTREGFLICEGVPIARTGEQLYAAGELGPTIKAGRDGLIRVQRYEDDVFAEDAIRSFEGKPIVATTHPPGKKVTPQNAHQYKVGHVQNIRRGEGEQANLLLADMVISHGDAIAKVRGGMRHVSAGYDARYIQETPGEAYQTGIHGNHVIFCPEGRAGSICSIGDSAMTTKPLTFRERLLSAFRSTDSDAFHDALAGMPDTPTVDATVTPLALVTIDEKEEGAESMQSRIAAMEAKLGEHESLKSDHAALKARFDAFEPSHKALGDSWKDLSGRLEDLEDDLYGDEEKKEAKEAATGDEKPVVIEPVVVVVEEPELATVDASEIADIRAKAEILSPGMDVATSDAATPDEAIAARRLALAMCMTTGASRDHVKSFLRVGMSVDTLTNDQVVNVFNGAAELARRANNSVTTRARSVAGVAQNPLSAGRIGDEDMNKINEEFWSRQRAG